MCETVVVECSTLHVRTKKAKEIFALLYHFCTITGIEQLLHHPHFTVLRTRPKFLSNL